MRIVSIIVAMLMPKIIEYGFKAGYWLGKNGAEAVNRLFSRDPRT